MTNTLKCAACNIVIDELLAYVQNKISVVDEVTLKRICVSAFTSSEIKTSKSLLFESLPTDRRKILRKNKGKEERDLDDIICVFKSVDPDVIPVFVARELERLPPVLFDHLDCTKLLKDLTRLNAEIEEVKNTYVTVKQIEELRLYIHELKHASLPPSLNPAAYVNMRRGAWNLDSGPVGLTMSHNSTSDEQEVHQSGNLQNISDIIIPDTQIVGNRNQNDDAMICTPLSRAVCKNDSPVAPAAKPISCERSADIQNTTLSPITDAVMQTTRTSAPEKAQDDPGSQSSHPRKSNMVLSKDKENINEWQMVKKRNKKPKYRYLGVLGKSEASLSSFKAAEKRIPIFITNIHSDAVEVDIVNYIKKKTQEKVSLEKIYTKKAVDHKAYKFLVPESKLSLFLDEKLWPQGIIFRRFIHYKNRQADTKTSAGGPIPSKYE